MALRFVWFVAIAFTAVAGPFWVAVVLGLVYCAHYQGLEVLAVALVVDAYFGYGTVNVPYVTLVTAAVLLVVIMVRPHLAIYG